MSRAMAASSIFNPHPSSSHSSSVRSPSVTSNTADFTASPARPPLLDPLRAEGARGQPSSISFLGLRHGRILFLVSSSFLKPSSANIGAIGDECPDWGAMSRDLHNAARKWQSHRKKEFDISPPHTIKGIDQVSTGLNLLLRRKRSPLSLKWRR